MKEPAKGVLEELKEDVKNPYFVALLVILGVATFLRFKYAFFQGMWVDEGRYARAALEIANHPWSYSTVEAYKGQITGWPPVYTYMLAFSTYVFGKTDFAIRFVSPAVSILGIAITYWMGSQMKNRAVGLLTAAMLAINPIYWFLSDRILIGATLTVIYTATMAALYYGLEDREYSKYALWAVGPLTALTLMTKQPAYTLGLIVPIYYIYRRRDRIDELRRSRKLEDLFYSFKDAWAALGLGVLTLLPWMLRNQAVCGVPLCGLQRAMQFASQSRNVDAAITSVQSSLYFIQNLPSIITLPLAAVLAVKVGLYILDWADEDPDHLVKAGAAIIFLTGFAYIFKIELLAMALISSISLLANRDSEKLLWLWAGIGIGFMSIPAVKVPRYIVFVVPALTTLGAITIYEMSGWISKVADNSLVTPVRIAAVLLLPVLFMSYTAGMNNMRLGGFSELEPAGKWAGQNLPEDAVIVSSSKNQMMTYAYPRVAHMPPKNKSEFKNFVEEKNATHMILDVYERAQPQWTQTDIAPYRLPNQVRAKIQKGQISPQQAGMMFKNNPDYLIPLQSFGKTRMPLSNRAQPIVIVYRINRTALQ